VSWYSTGLRDSNEFRQEVNRLGDPAAVRDRIRAFYEPAIERMAA
jgi:tRNA-dihydrouridine synthase B